MTKTPAAALATRVVPIRLELRSLSSIPKSVNFDRTKEAATDLFGRPLRDLRISVIDQCNFRCSYCMPKSVFGKDYKFLPKSDLLSVAEIGRLAEVFVALGVRKFRLTGGEPLLRKELPEIIEALSKLRANNGEEIDIALTTNGSLLAKKASALQQSGLKRVTVSLDAIDDQVFQRMNDVGYPVADVLKGIDEAILQGLGPIKVNMVVKRGDNDCQMLPMAEYFRSQYGDSVSLRFIEFMDVGHSNDWKLDKVVPSREIVQRLQERFPIEPIESARVGETAERWRYLDGLGEVGFISSVTQPFCGDCCRARISADGRLFTCLFAQDGYDLRDQLRASVSRSSALNGDLEDEIRSIWFMRRDKYSEFRSARTREQRANRVEMHYIGG